jgi:hypothetical protein
MACGKFTGEELEEPGILGSLRNFLWVLASVAWFLSWCCPSYVDCSSLPLQG